MIIEADQGDWDRTIPTLVQWAEARLRELGGHLEATDETPEERARRSLHETTFLPGGESGG